MSKLHNKVPFPFLLTLGLFLVFSGCSSDDNGGPGPGGPEPGGSSSATIDQNGGSVDYGAASVTILANTLAAPVEITVGIPETEPEYDHSTSPGGSNDQIGYIYEMGPAGTIFNPAATVEFEYSEDDLNGGEESSLLLWSFDNEGDAPTQLNNIQINTDDNTITGETGHFSYFLLTVFHTNLPPEAPILSSPANGATNQSTALTLSWNANANTDWYHIQLATDAGFSNILIEQLEITETSYAVMDLELNTTYYWRVMAYNQFGESDWSETWSFTTGDGGGGLIVGSWEYDSGEWEFIGLPPDFDIFMEGWGDFIVDVNTNGTYHAEGVQTIHSVTTVFEAIIVDTTYDISINQEGTYSTEGDSLTTTVTYDEYNPENVGMTMTQYYEVNENTFMTRMNAFEGGYGAIATAYFTRQ